MKNLFNGIYNKKKVLVTGHTGFKGSWLALWLTEMGAEVVGYALDPPTIPNHFELLKLPIESVIGDIRDLKKIKETFALYQPEIVFHLAAQPLVKYSYIEPRETFETNIMGTVNVFEACRSTDSVKAIINVTSDKCYENREWIWGYRENDPMGGYDPYSCSKGCSELVTSAYRNSFYNPAETGKSHHTQFASVRAGNVIGGGDWAGDRLIPDIIRAFMNKETIKIRYPDAVRPWQHVLEPLYGYLLLAERLHAQKTEYASGWNFGPPDDDTKPVKWIANRISDLWKDTGSWEIESGYKLHEANVLRLDCSKARTKLGWRPRLTLEQALEWTVEWYKNYDKVPEASQEISKLQICRYNSLGSK